MKTFLVVVVLLAASATWALPSEPEAQIKIPQECKDVFSVKVCDKITEMATNLKLKAETSKEAFKNAIQQGKTKVEDVYESCKKFYLEKVKTKKCEDFVSAETCKKLRVAAENLKIKAAEFEVFVKNALLAGKNTAVDVYNKVVEYYNNEVKGKSCEELLSKTKINPAVCTTLRKAATSVKVKTEYVTKIVRDALINGYNNATAIVNTGIQKIKDWAKNIKCEDLLNPGLCTALREYSMKFKVAFPKIMETVRDLLIKGYNVATGFLKIVYKITDAFIDCEHIFTADSCKLIKNKVTAIGGKLTEMGAAVREYATKAIEKTKDIYHKIATFTKAKWCKWFKVGCSTSKRSVAMVKRSSALTDLLNKYKEMLAKGIAAAKRKLKQSMEHLMDSLKIVDETLRNIVRKAIEDGKMKYSELKELLKKMVDVATGKGNSTADAVKMKRDIKIKLVDALQNAHSHLKAAIEYLITKTSEELKKMHNYIQSLLTKVFNDKTKREIDDIDMMEIMGDELVKLENQKAVKEASLLADELFDETIEDIMEIENDSAITENIQKRDLTSGMTTIKDFFGKVGDNLKEVLSKLRNINIQTIKESFNKAGMKLIGVAEEILKKIEEALQQ